MGNFNETELEERKNQLEAKLEKHQKENATSNRKHNDGAGFAQAMRLSTEFVVGILVGTGIGWFIDYAFGTKPWGMIIFLLLGFCAGVLNVLRAANLIAEQGVKRTKNDYENEDDADLGGKA
jgi:ATP synthase protein I